VDRAVHRQRGADQRPDDGEQRAERHTGPGQPHAAAARAPHATAREQPEDDAHRAERRRRDARDRERLERLPRRDRERELPVPALRLRLRLLGLGPDAVHAPARRYRGRLLLRRGSGRHRRHPGLPLRRRLAAGAGLRPAVLLPLLGRGLGRSAGAGCAGARPRPGRGGLLPTLRSCLLPALRVRGLLPAAVGVGLLPAAVGVGLLPLLVGRGPLRRLGDRLLRGRRGRLGHAGGGRCLVVVGAGPGRDGARPRARFRRLTHVRNPSGHGADGVEATGARGTHARRHRRRVTSSGGRCRGRPNRHGRRSTPLASGNRPSDGGTPDRRHRPGRRPAVTRRAAPAQPVRPSLPDDQRTTMTETRLPDVRISRRAVLGGLTTAAVVPAALASLPAAPAAAHGMRDLRVLPYLQNPSSTSMTVAWVSYAEVPGTLTVTGPGLRGRARWTSTPESMPVLGYTEAERAEQIPGLEDGSWLLPDGNVKHVVEVTGLRADSHYTSMPVAWVSYAEVPGTLTVTGPGLRGRARWTSTPESMPVLGYTEAERAEQIPGLEDGSWLLPDGNVKHVVEVTGLRADSHYTYVVEQGRDSYRGSFRTAPTASDWKRISFIAMSDHETEPRGRVTRR